MAYHRKGGKSAKRRSMKSKKGGRFGSLISQLSTPAVLFAANHVYGKKTRRNRKKKVGGRKYHKKSAKKSKKRSKKHSRK